LRLRSIMMMPNHALLHEIAENPTIQEIFLRLQNQESHLAFHEVNEAGLGPLLALIAFMLKQPFLFLSHSEEKARAIFGDVSLFVENARFFPNREPEPLEDPTASGERALILEELLKGEKLFLFSSPSAVLLPTQAPEALKKESLSLEVGKSFPMKALASLLESWGYRHVEIVQEKKEFAIRGGILDCFLLSLDAPCRIEWFGEEIDSIRIFDPITQRSIQKISSLDFFPPENLHGETATLLDYLQGEWLLVSDPLLLQNPEHQSILEWSKKQKFLKLLQTPFEKSLVWPFKPVESFAHRFRDFLKYLEKNQKGKNFIFTRQASRIKEILQENLLSGIEVVASPLSRGFFIPENHLFVYTDDELFGRVVPPFKRIAASRPVALEELKEGEIVVHAYHGIARYNGIVPLEVEGSQQDYLALEFADEDRLYVPLQEIDHIERYVGPPGKTPSLSRLGSREWKNAKKKARKAAEEIAHDLVRLYASRSQLLGYAFSPDTPWQREMEEAFPFEETPDQKKAVEETKADMEKPVPMDRLIVGDVGFGKTEVALRAAFKAVMDGKQVAILVPTTVLAKQHYETFSERLSTFPVRIELLSRFKKKKEQEKILLGLFSGEIDILIGTHRILQKDVHFKNLGLLIIDEEQRFGVAHKEALKKLKQNVDTLTLSATPIPRTFYLSLVGGRDISVIDTPPKDRLPVKTFVLEKNNAIIQKAIQRELEREGQVYYLYNNIETIHEKERELKAIVPSARIIIAHGKMKGEELEEVMWEFMQGLHDILLCTTIIENGLDIPRVNTLIVENAHRFGLAQLYQLRGRVGRSDRQAYAYFLIPNKEKISQHADERLCAIQEFSHLGSGYQIALKDLEIRGAGNLLGLAQHGHVASVGYHLYCQMIAEEIKKMKGEKIQEQTPQIQLRLPIPAFLPETYVPSRAQKLDLYRRLALCKSHQEVDEIFDEMVDRYGDPPKEALNLLEMAKLRIWCLENHAYEVVAKDGEAKIRFWDGRKELSVTFQGRLPIKVSF
jgi:transcription-repair coupling factor